MGPSTYMETRDGIGPIENVKRDFGLRGFLDGVGHGGFVGVKARANILNIEDQRVNSSQHFGRGAPDFSVEAENANALLQHLSRRRYCRTLRLAVNAVFGGKQRGDIDTGGAHHVDITSPRADRSRSDW